MAKAACTWIRAEMLLLLLAASNTGAIEMEHANGKIKPAAKSEHMHKSANPLPSKNLEKSEAEKSEKEGKPKLCKTSYGTEYPCPDQDPVKWEAMNKTDCCQQYVDEPEPSDEDVFPPEVIEAMAEHINENCLNWQATSERTTTECRRAYTITQARRMREWITNYCHQTGRFVLAALHDNLLATLHQVESVMSTGLVMRRQNTGVYLSSTANLLRGVRFLLPRARMFCGICIITESDESAIASVRAFLERVPEGGGLTKVQLLGSEMDALDKEMATVVRATESFRDQILAFREHLLAEAQNCWARKLAGGEGDCPDAESLTRDGVNKAHPNIGQGDQGEGDKESNLERGGRHLEVWRRYERELQQMEAANFDKRQAAYDFYKDTHPDDRAHSKARHGSAAPVVEG